MLTTGALNHTTTAKGWARLSSRSEARDRSTHAQSERDSWSREECPCHDCRNRRGL